IFGLADVYCRNGCTRVGEIGFSPVKKIFVEKLVKNGRETIQEVPVSFYKRHSNLLLVWVKQYLQIPVFNRYAIRFFERKHGIFVSINCQLCIMNLPGLKKNQPFC